MISNQLLTFIIVAENKSMTKAAEQLFISPTAVKKQIDILEERLEVKLFNRTHHGLELTKAGMSILSDAKYLSDYANRAKTKAQKIYDEENEMTIRIGTSVMTPAKFILDIWNQVQKRAPNLKIELIPFENTPENAKEILSNLGTQIDIVAGIYDDTFMKERGFQVVKLEDKQLSFAIPINNKLANNDVVTGDNLKETGVMFIKKGWNRYIDELRVKCENKGINVIEFEFFNLNAFNTAVQKNIPIIAIDGWENIHPLLKIVSANTKIKVPYGIMYSSNPSKQVKQFVNIVKKILN